LVATAFAVAALLFAPSISGTAAAAALACAFDPDFGAVLRAVLAGALRVAFARDLEADAEAERFAGAFRAVPDDFEAAEVFRVAGFFLPALERVEPDLPRLLGFFGVAMPGKY
jgi:hypothetical protein